MEGPWPPKRDEMKENITRKMIYTPSMALPRKVMVTRYRDSDGKQYVKVNVGTGVINISHDVFGKDYEQVARELGEMLLKAASDPCSVTTKGENE
jgi:hypothetical protein